MSSVSYESIDIHEYIDDWLEKKSKSKKQTDSDDEENYEENENKQGSKIYKSKLNIISKKFKKLKFDENWERKILSKNFVLYGVETKCMEKFLTLEVALYNCGYNIRSSGLKNQILKYIKDLTQWEFMQLLDEYKNEKTSGHFSGRWDPFGVKSKNDFIREFKSPHFTLENDSIMISIISEITNLDFIIFHNNYCIQDLAGKKLNDKIILLYKMVDDEGKVYFCCIGLKNKRGNVKTSFDREKLPDEIKLLLDKDDFIFKHINNVINNFIDNNNKLRLNEIINELEKALCCKFSNYELKNIVKIINSILQNKEYFKN